MTSKAPVIEIIDDDDDDDDVDVAAAPTPALPRKRRRATPSTAAGASPDFLDAFSPTPPAPPSPDFPDAFCPSPIRPWKQRVSVTPIPLDDDDDDDTPPPPKRRPSVPPILLDDDDTPTSPYVPEIPDNAAAETPGFATPRTAGPSSTAPASPSTARVPTLSGASCPISLDSDDELDDFGSREPFSVFISPCKNSTVQEKHNMEENAQPIKQTKEKKERKRLSKEEKDKMVEEKKQQQEERKMQKEAYKVQQAEKKKLDKQKADWDSGKDALKSIIAKIDPAVIETGSIGGPLLTRFTEKKLRYQVEHNLMPGSILWKMVRKIDQHPDSVSEVPYILFVLQAEEFCNLIRTGEFWCHVQKVQNHYPTFTVCYITNKLMKYIKDSEQSRYKNSSSSDGFKRKVEQALCKLVTHYDRVHSKQCVDEAEVADHIVGLTTSLANCQFRKPLTRLSVHAKGVILPNGFVDKAHNKKDSWLMSLIAIPKVQPRFALAITKKYGTMRSLLNVYMDPSKTDLEKELVLADLKCEDCLGEESRMVGPVCSRRVYRILMAQDGAMDADEAEKS